MGLDGRKQHAYPFRLRTDSLAQSVSPSPTEVAFLLIISEVMYTPYTVLVYSVDMKATTTQRISSAARRLLDQEGAEGVTMRRVATAVGITPMALYRHYPNRNGLLNTVADSGFVELAAKLAELRLTGRIDRQLLKILDVFLDHAFDNPRLFELMFLKKREGARQYPDDFKARRSPTANVSADVIARAMETGYLNKDD